MNESVLSLQLACYQAVQSFPGGAPAVAGAFGWNPRTLQNKLNPTQPHKLTAEEVEGILQLTRDSRILDAIGSSASAVWIDVSEIEAIADDMAILDNVTKLVQRVGELSGKLHSSLADGEVDQNEMADLQSATIALTQSAFAVLEKAKQFQK